MTALATAGTLILLSACTSEDIGVKPAVAAESKAPAEVSSNGVIATQASTTPGDSPVVASVTDPSEGRRPDVVVYKSATCGCCKDWVSYLEDEGFNVKAIDHDNVDQIKAENGLTDPALKSCHTALVDGYVIEGHVPVSDIERLLAERPDVTGLTAPGMPMMSPGMGSLVPKDYDVLAFDKAGNASVYSSY